MNSPTLIYIRKSQEEYLDLLLQYREYVQGDGLSIARICALLDEVKCFWLERLKIIEFELDELAESTTCFVLSGAIFLNVSEYEHYYFKSFGDCHLLTDPFSKLELFFRIPEEEINYQFTTDYFKRAFFDTIEILTTYKGYFFILPIHEISVDDPERHRELLGTFFWRFISNAFNSDFEDSEEFCSKYGSFEEIESDLNSFTLEHLIFNDFGDIALSLRERIERYQSEQKNLSSRIVGASEAQKFLICVSSYVAQIADILYICAILRINPYIRFNVTFNYLTLVMYTFINEKKLREIIEKALICYLFRKTIEEKRFEKIGFSAYCKRLEDKSLLNNVLEKVRSLGINILKDNPDKVVSIIDEEFSTII
jgi:hypothetical protein